MLCGTCHLDLAKVKVKRIVIRLEPFLLKCESVSVVICGRMSSAPIYPNALNRQERKTLKTHTANSALYRTVLLLMLSSEK